MTGGADVNRLPPETVLIVGAGLAGLYCALRLERTCLVISADSPGQGGSSVSAQGGIAAALAPGDTPAAHAADTIAAGAGLSDPEAVGVLTEEGPRHVAALADLGVPFDRDENGQLALGLEAAHSQPRVARVRGDLAGREIMKAVGRSAIRRAAVTLRTGVTARALLRGEDGRVAGVRARDESGHAIDIVAGDTVLATGGVGGLYAVTTNPATARGDAIAMAAAVGATVADPEFVQFHPTAIDVARDPAPLATEALRGEGARLVDRDGRPLSEGPDGDLAARDIVARSVHDAILTGRGAWLDATSIGREFPELFPTVFDACQQADIDPRSTPIPVAPAAHYHMGGIVTDLWGRTTVPGLWALGEAASTGVHGANRLASNSLLEALVFAARAAATLDDDPVVGRQPLLPVPAATDELPGPALARLRKAMATHAGVLRDAPGLSRLITLIDAQVETHGPSAALMAARLIATGALARTESRGAHFRRDERNLDPVARRTFLSCDASGNIVFRGSRPSVRDARPPGAPGESVDPKGRGRYATDRTSP